MRSIPRWPPASAWPPTTGQKSSTSHTTPATTPQLDAAAAYAKSKGALTLITTGNTDAYRSIPAYSNLIFVSGIQENGQRWSEGGGVGSSYGPFVDLAAPASDILLADPTTIHGYGLNSGTSFAVPPGSRGSHLAWSIDPLLTPDQVEQMLYDTAVNPDNPNPGSSTPYSGSTGGDP